MYSYRYRNRYLLLSLKIGRTITYGLEARAEGAELRRDALLQAPVAVVVVVVVVVVVGSSSSSSSR